MQVRSLARLLLAGILLLAGVLPLSVGAETSGLVDVVTVPDGKRILGWVENMRMMPSNMVMKAKLDPGAKSSAVHAENIEEFEKNGRRMVRFSILSDHRDPDSERIVLERPLVREVSIKLRNTTRRDRRLAVRLEFCLAGEIHNGLFSLTNRNNFNYPVLLGRSFLSDRILVDSGNSFTHQTRCPRQ